MVVWFLYSKEHIGGYVDAEGLQESSFGLKFAQAVRLIYGEIDIEWDNPGKLEWHTWIITFYGSFGSLFLLINFLLNIFNQGFIQDQELIEGTSLRYQLSSIKEVDRALRCKQYPLKNSIDFSKKVTKSNTKRFQYLSKQHKSPEIQEPHTQATSSIRLAKKEKLRDGFSSLSDLRGMFEEAIDRKIQKRSIEIQERIEYFREETKDFMYTILEKINSFDTRETTNFEILTDRIADDRVIRKGGCFYK